MTTHPPPPPAEDDEDSFDASVLRDWISYATRAARRRWPVVLGLALLCFAGAVAFSRTIPSRYLVEARLLDQRPEVIAILTNPSRPLRLDRVTGNRPVGDLVLSRENLLSLVRQTGLLDHWRTKRPTGLRERLSLSEPLSDEALTEELLGELERRLQAWSNQGGTIDIRGNWFDPEMAYRIVEVAVQNLLETRHATDMAFLDESIRLLETHVGEARRELDDAIAAASDLPEPAQRRVVSDAVEASATAPPVDAALAQLTSQIVAKRSTLTDLVTLRERRIGELQAQLAEQRAVYADSHPVVANISRAIDALNTESPQVAELRREIEDLEARYVAGGGDLAELGSESRRLAAAPSSARPIITALQSPTRDATEEYARSRLAAAITHYYTAADRLRAVQVEREAERAGIKYKYAVVRPPRPPRGPVNSRVKRLIAVVGLLLGPLVGVTLAVGMELRRGRIVQRWQIERSLGLPVLAEVPVGSRSGEGGRS